MTATAPIPAAEATPMAHTPEPSDPPAEAASSAAPAAAAARTRRWAVLGENPLQTVLATAVVALLLFILNDHSSRLGRIEDKFDALEAQIDKRFAEQDAKLEALDAKFDELNLKLTALIAALNKTDEIDAALEGRLSR